MKRKEALADNSQAERAQSNVGENAQQVQDMAMDGSKAIIGAAIEDSGDACLQVPGPPTYPRGTVSGVCVWVGDVWVWVWVWVWACVCVCACVRACV